MRGNRAGRTRNGGTTTTTSRPTFKGDTEDMNGNVFQCYEEQADRRQYAKTIEALDAYVKKKLNYSADLAPLLERRCAPDHRPAWRPAPGAGETMKMIFAEEVKEYVKRTRALASNIATVFAVIWGQCSENMKARVKTSEYYADKATKNDCFWLLRQIKSITLQFDESKNAILSLLDAQQSFLSCKQLPGQSADDYADCLIGWAETIETHGGTVAADYTLIPETGDDGLPRDVQRRKALARERTLAMALIRSADRSRYGTLITDLRNQYASGRDEYPTDVVTAKGLLVTYKTPVNAPTNRNANTRTQQVASPEASAMTFAQRSSSVLVPGTNGLTHEDIQCWTCQQHGHYAGNCPSGETTPGTTLTQYAFMLAQSAAPAPEHEHVIDPDWILLDSQSTMSVFRNAKMLRNIRHSGRVLRALTNGGYQDSTMIGDFPNLGEVWFNKQSIANILSLAEVRKVCRVTMDTSDEPALHVHRLDGSVMKFVEHPSGLYVYKSNDTSDRVTGYTMVNTVAKQKKLFSRREVRAADQARDLYRKIGRPAETEFVELLKCNAIRNCPVTPSDAQRALIIYGPDVATIKGKTTHSHAAPRAPTFIAEHIPAAILEHHRDVTLCVDFFCPGTPIPPHHLSRYRISHCAPSPRPKQTYDFATFAGRDQTVPSAWSHRTRRTWRPRIWVHPRISTSHRPKRRTCRQSRRRSGAVHPYREGTPALLRTRPPFKRLPRLLVQHMVADTIRCLNQFPWPNGISATMSPASIVTGVGTPDYNCMRIEFGAYAQVFEDNSPSNTLRARSLGAIALTPTGNAQGDYFFLSLATGNRLSRHQWTELPMTDTAIARTEALALHEKQPLLQTSGLVVEWRPDQPIDDSEYDRDYVPPADTAAPHVFDADDYDDIDVDEINDLLADNPYAPLADAADQGAEDDNEESDDDYSSNDPNDGGAAYDFDESDDDDGNDNVPNDAHDDDVDNVPNDGAQQAAEDEGAKRDEDEGAQRDEHEEGAQPYATDEDEGAQPYETENADEDEGAQQHATEDAVLHDATERPYNLRQRLPANKNNTFKQAMDTPHDGKSYFPPTQLLQQEGHSFAQLMNQLAGSSNIREQVKRHGKTAETTLMKHVFGFIMNQMSAKAGIRKHGKAAEIALMNEFAQLEDLSAYESIDPNTLTRKQRKEALRAINLLKEKRDGSLRARTVADGRPQRSMYDKSQTASPTVSTDALMLSIMIDAKEARDVATADVVAAYLKAFMDDFVIMKFTGGIRRHLM
ncbi:Reverse transcriptase (RNA-dependent DNA polymerase) [Fragilaria crotonensis]|nr:Reverse transcriptase (RNA-dependent DNA polymerase) [Fragilaria crotonensis]